MERIKIGDKVIISNSMESKNLDVVPEMVKYKGKTAKIIDCRDEKYFLDIDNGFWGWTAEMFECV